MTATLVKKRNHVWLQPERETVDIVDPRDNNKSLIRLDYPYSRAYRTCYFSKVASIVGKSFPDFIKSLTDEHKVKVTMFDMKENPLESYEQQAEFISQISFDSNGNVIIKNPQA